MCLAAERTGHIVTVIMLDSRKTNKLFFRTSRQSRVSVRGAKVRSPFNLRTRSPERAVTGYGKVVRTSGQTLFRLKCPLGLPRIDGAGTTRLDRTYTWKRASIPPCPHAWTQGVTTVNPVITLEWFQSAGYPNASGSLGG
jgi:hypothetical protein